MIANILTRMGPAASEAIPILIDIKENLDPVSKISAASALYCIGYNKTENLEWLLDRLNNETDQSILVSIVDNLRLIGPDARGAIPRLIEFANEPTGWTWHYSIYALVDIEGSGDTVIPILTAKLKDDSEYIRERSVEMLLDLSKRIDISGAIPALLESLNDEDYIRETACMILAGYGSYGERVVPVLLDLFAENPDQIWNIFETLSKIGLPAADRAESLVLDVIREHNPDTMWIAVNTYSDIWGATETLLEILLDTISRPDYQESYSAADKLAELGAQAASTLPTLRGLLDNNETNREYVQMAIDAIEADIQNQP
jgi:HEAT repeat protein